MGRLQELLDRTLWNDSALRWIFALAAGAAVFLAVLLTLRILRGRLTALAGRTATLWDDVVVHALGKTRRLVVLVVALRVSASFLTLPPRAERAIGVLSVLAVLFQIGIWLTSGLGLWLELHTKRHLEADRGAATTMLALGFAGKLLAWVVLLLVALDNIGIDVTALVAGLGIGGVAIALAVQNILGDLFASLSIVLDKPFVLGDFVIVDDFMGNVEHIGLKTTRVRSLWGEQVIFSNSDLLKSRLRNFGRMSQRRVVFEIGVTYQTPRAKLEAIPGIVREAVESRTATRFDRSHFKAYGDSSLTYESVYFVLSADYNLYMDIQQAVNLRIHERFEEEGIEFAYPTQTLFLTRTGAAPAPADSARAG